jgi:hypothetical protein
MLSYLFRLWSEVIIPIVVNLERSADPRLHCRSQLWNSKVRRGHFRNGCP